MAKNRALRSERKSAVPEVPGVARRDAQVTTAVGTVASAAPPASLQALVVSAPALGAVKWLAVILMVLDHTNKYLFDSGVPWMYGAGRISMPLFALLLGYNLARPAMTEPGTFARLGARLGIFGLLAELPFVAVNHLALGWWPLNMLFTFLLAVCCCYLFDHTRAGMKMLGWVVLAWGGGLVEFWWPAVGLVLCAWAYQRKPGWEALVGLAVCLSALWFINGNFWALAAVPVLAVFIRYWRWPVPRAKWFFYAFYPAHLALFWMLMS